MAWLLLGLGGREFQPDDLLLAVTFESEIWLMESLIDQNEERVESSADLYPSHLVRLQFPVLVVEDSLFPEKVFCCYCLKHQSAGEGLQLLTPWFEED